MFSKVALLAVIVAVCAALPKAVPNNPEWSAFKQKFGKDYVSPSEEWKRHIVFMSNLQLINQHNDRYAQGLETYAMAVNHMADMSLEEFQSRNNYRMRQSTKTAEMESVNALPSTVDWRPKGYVTPVKDQGQCGSCWSFSATGSLEGQHFAATGKLVSLSEQNLVDCAHESYGCDGGWADAAFDYIIANGVDTEASYPYEARDGSCRFKSHSVGATMSDYVDLRQGDEQALKQAAATIGPISVAIDASHFSFQFYSHGIYNEPSCSTTRLDHAVLVVGYGTDNGQDYWLVKNSWNTNWGDKGYIKMQRNHNNACGIATQAGYPKV